MAPRIGEPDVVEAFFLGPAGVLQGGFDPGLDGYGDRDASGMAQIESTPNGIPISSGVSPPWSPGWRLSNRSASYHQTARPGWGRITALPTRCEEASRRGDVAEVPGGEEVARRTDLGHPGEGFPDGADRLREALLAKMEGRSHGASRRGP